MAAIPTTKAVSFPASCRRETERPLPLSVRFSAMLVRASVRLLTRYTVNTCLLYTSIHCALSYQNQLLADIKSLLEQLTVEQTPSDGEK